MLKICIGGDISFGNIEVFSWGDNLKKILEQHDLIIANLEAPLTKADRKRNFKSYYLRANPDSVNWLMPFTALSLANNHIMDYRIAGLIDTIDTLDKSKIMSFGAGIDRDSAFQPVCFEKNGVKVAIFGVTHFLRSSLIRRAGTADVFSKKLIKSLRAFKENGFFNIVIPHWGYEYLPYPSPRERNAARKLIENGADIIVGSHPHEIQAHEVISGRHVYYSLGNWVFSLSDFELPDPKLSQSLVLSIKITQTNQYAIEPLICVYQGDMAELADVETSLRNLAYLNEVSEKLSLNNFQYNKLFYDCYTQVHIDRIKKKAVCKNMKAMDRAKLTKLKDIFTQMIIRIGWLDAQTIKIAIYVKIPFLRKLIILSSHIR